MCCMLASIFHMLQEGHSKILLPTLGFQTSKCQQNKNPAPTGKRSSNVWQQPDFQLHGDFSRLAVFESKDKRAPSREAGCRGNSLDKKLREENNT